MAGLGSRGLTERADNHPCEISKIVVVRFCGTSDCTDAPILQNLHHETDSSTQQYTFYLSSHLYPFELSHHHQTRLVEMIIRVPFTDDTLHDTTAEA